MFYRYLLVTYNTLVHAALGVILSVVGYYVSRLCVRDRYAHSLYCGIVHTTHRYNEELASSINS